MYVLEIVVCPFVLFRLVIVFSVHLGFTDSDSDSDYPFGIFKLFLSMHLFRILVSNTIYISDKV